MPSLDDFMGDDRGEFLLCLIRALHKYLSWTEQYQPGIKFFFFFFFHLHRMT